MLSTIGQVNEEFFKKFQDVHISVKGADIHVPCRYARMSSWDYTEETSGQTYPCIAIQDYAPVLRDGWYVDHRRYHGGVSSDGKKSYMYYRPVWLDFRYDVGIASKSYHEFVALQDHFSANYLYNVGFMFNEEIVDGESIGDVVPYTVMTTNVPRNDGVFEINYEFTCSVWLYARSPQEYENIMRVIVDGEPVGM